jgi:hypothetical protein
MPLEIILAIFSAAISNLLFRLMQNRKSAKKCRLKKKAEFVVLKSDVDLISKENNDLKMRVSRKVINF